MTTTKAYDYLNRLTGLTNSAGGSNVAGFKYTYNTANQRTGMTNVDSSRWIYMYDALGQVISGKKYWSDGTPVAGQQFEYGFDDIGNRKSTAAGGDAAGANLRPANYTNNLLNQIIGRDVPGYANVLGRAHSNATVSLWSPESTSQYARTTRKGEYFRGELPVNNSSTAVWMTITNLAVLNDGNNPDIVTNTVGNTFVPKTAEMFYYDYDGNLTNDGRWTYTWDAENRLVRMVANTAVGPQQRIEFEYDAKSRRIGKKVWNNTAGTGSPAVEQKFVYDGWNLLAILSSSSSLLSSYVWGLDLSGSEQGAGGVGGLLMLTNSGNGTHYCAYDGNGNLATLVKATDGAVTANYEYGPFGEPLRVTGAMGLANAFRFSTKYQDDETDLLYYGYRSYNPSTGRWLSRDPIEERGGLNNYHSVANDSIGRYDLCGLQDFSSDWFPIRQTPWYDDSWAFLRAQLIVSVDGAAPNQGIRISFKANRPDTPENKYEWSKLDDPRGFPLTDGWRWPNLAALFNARGSMRYGGPYGGEDNDFGAVVVRRQGASSLSMPLVSGDWVNDNGVTQLASISHDIHIKEKFSLWMTSDLCHNAAPVELWFAVCDMGMRGRRGPRGWPIEWAGTDVLYVKIAWKETFGGLEPVFERPTSAPPASPMQMRWKGWKAGGAIPIYFDLDMP